VVKTPAILGSSIITDVLIFLKCKDRGLCCMPCLISLELLALSLS
jgi:hypothetical protein